MDKKQHGTKNGISRREFLKGSAGSLLMFVFFGLLSACQSQNQEQKPIETPENTEMTVMEPSTSSDPVLDDSIDLVSLNSINILVNKKHPLPEDYVPEGMIAPDVLCMKDGILLQKEAAEAIKEMFVAAEEEEIYLAIGSAYRSYAYQKTLYENYVKRDGEEAANRYSAKPGQSEHQTGLAADLAASNGNCYLKDCFKDTEEGKWLKKNAWKFGFILRYPEGKEEVTGYIFEPWHYRYIGQDEAKKVYESGLTLEEYYEILD